MHLVPCPCNLLIMLTCVNYTRVCLHHSLLCIWINKRVFFNTNIIISLSLSPRALSRFEHTQAVVCKLVPRVEIEGSLRDEPHTDDGAFGNLPRSLLLLPVPLRRQIGLFNGARKRPDEGETRLSCARFQRLSCPRG